MFAYEMIAEARKIAIPDNDFNLSVKGNVYAFDSTTIDLCLNVFWWATFRRAKAAVKLHTLLDVKTSIPVFVHFTPASVHDVRGLDELIYETGGYYIMDRGYIDFERLSNIDKHDAFFVIRAKNNLQSFVFLSHNFELPALEIALLYKYRWKIELFFKWIKQHLKIKSFWGTPENAVKIQIYVAIITYILVMIIKEKLKLKQSLYEILQIMSVSLLDKTHLPSLFNNPIYQDVKEQNNIQLKINLI
jgi:transposase